MLPQKAAIGGATKTVDFVFAVEDFPFRFPEFTFFSFLFAFAD